MDLTKPLIARGWEAVRLQIDLDHGAGLDAAARHVSHMVTHAPGFVYTSDRAQRPNPEVGLPGHQPEAVRSHHKAILRGEQPEGDCDDFTETCVQLLYMAGVDARRLVKVIVADENQFRTEVPADRLRVSHIVGGLYFGPMPSDGHVARLLAKDPQHFHRVINVGDTWDQARPTAQHTPFMRQSPDGLYNRHLPLSVQGLATGLTEYAVKGAEAILRRSGLLTPDLQALPRPYRLRAVPLAGTRNTQILSSNGA